MTESVWNQAVLPVSRGGLGIRAATHVALPAFLFSVTSAESLTVQLLPPRLHPTAGISDPLFEQAAEFTTKSYTEGVGFSAAGCR